jgi:hypothetical protein
MKKKKKKKKTNKEDISNEVLMTHLNTFLPLPL